MRRLGRSGGQIDLVVCSMVAFFASPTANRLALQRISHGRRGGGGTHSGFNALAGVSPPHSSPAPPASGGANEPPTLQSLLSDSTVEGKRGANGPLILRMLRPGITQEMFYFKDDAKQYCRLCHEEIQSSPKGHIVASSRASHTNHSVRETILEHMALLCSRGYGVEDIMKCWSYVLFDQFQSQRIHGLSNPDWSVEQRAAKVCEMLCILRDMGVIDLSLAVQGAAESCDLVFVQTRRRAAFERLEIIGDNTWGTHMSSRMMVLFSDRQWQYSECAYSFNTMRDALEMNTHLEQMFDLLDIMKVLPEAIRDKVGTGKIKADVLESILGELHISLWGWIPKLYDSEDYVEINGEGQTQLASLVQHVLTETYDTMILALLDEIAKAAMPLAEELAGDHIWKVAAPSVMRSRDRTGHLRRRNISSSGGQTFLLPALARLCPEPTKPPRHAPHPLHNQKSLLQHGSPFICTHTKRDLFARQVHLIDSANLVDDTIPDLRRPKLAPDVASLIHQLSIPFSTSDVPADYVSFDIEPSDLYFRDRALGLKPTRPGDDEELVPAVSLSSPSSAFDQLNVISPPADDFDPLVLCRSTFPPLAKERQVVEAAAAVVEVVTCQFAPSRFVPEGTKPPSAGVITDKNLCFGQYVFPDLATHADIMKALHGKPNPYFILASASAAATPVVAQAATAATLAEEVPVDGERVSAEEKVVGP